MMLKPSRTTALIALALLVGCIPLQSVKDYSSYSRATIESVGRVAKDYFDSCLRLNAYRPAGQYNTCAEIKAASRGILKIAEVLDAYGAALGALSSDELVNYGVEFGEVSDEVKKQLNIDQKKLDAVERLANFIATAVTSQYQQAQVSQFVQECNSAVIGSANTLADLVENAYTDFIKVEIQQGQLAFGRLENQNDYTSLEWANFSREHLQIQSNLEAKLSAAERLAQNIRGIGSTHEKLKQDADDLSSEEIYIAVRKFIETAQPVIEEVQEAFDETKE